MKDQKLIKLTVLFDIYGDILTEKQKEFFDLYYNNDLSLGEISENEGITRQGVRDSIHRAETVLFEMEEKLGLAARVFEMNMKLRGIGKLAEEIIDINGGGYGSTAIREKAVEIAGTVNSLLDD